MDTIASSSASSSSSTCISTPLTSFYQSDSAHSNKRKQFFNQPSIIKKRHFQTVSVVIPPCPLHLIRPTKSSIPEPHQHDPDLVDPDPEFIPIDSSSSDDDDSEETDRRKQAQADRLKQKILEEDPVIVIPFVYNRFKSYFSCLKSVSNDSLGPLQNPDINYSSSTNRKLSSSSSIKLNKINDDDEIQWVSPRWRVSKKGEDFYQSVEIQGHQILINSVVSCQRKTGYEFSYRRSRLKMSTDQNYGSDTAEEEDEDFLDWEKEDNDSVNCSGVRDRSENITQCDVPNNNFNGRRKKRARPNLRRFQVRALFERDGVKYFHGTWLQEASRSFVGSAAEPNELLLIDKCYEIGLKFVSGIERVNFISADHHGSIPKNELYCRFHWKPTEGTFTDLPRVPKPKPPNPINDSSSVCSICLTVRKEMEWLTDPQTGEILLGKTDQYESLGFTLRGQETYRLNDFVRVSSSTSASSDLDLIGQIVEICGIRANPNIANTIVIDEAPFRPPPSVYSKLLTQKPVVTIRTYSRQAWTGSKIEKFNDDRRLWITSNEVLVDVKNNLKGKCQIVHLVKHRDHHSSSSSFVTLGTHRQVKEDSISDRDHCFYSILPTSKQESYLCSVPIVDQVWKSSLISREPEWIKIEDEEALKDRPNYKDIIKNYPEIGKLRHLELFGGIGSMTVALIELGLASQEETMFIDISLPACHTLAANFPRSKVICADVNKVLQLMIEGKSRDNQDFLIDLRTGQKVHHKDLPRPGDFDLITAGFPCGSHSTLNVLRKANDPKNALCATALSFIAYLKPDYLFFENVRGLIKTSFINPSDNSVLDKAFLRLICGTLISLGYQVGFGILQAAQFGSPQARRRIIFSGTRPGLTPVRLPEPTHHFPDGKLAIVLPENENNSQTQTHTTPNNLVRADYRKTSSGSLKPITVKDAISDLPGFEYLNPNQVMGKYRSYSNQQLEEDLSEYDLENREIVKGRSRLIPQLDRFISFSDSFNQSRIGLIGFDEFQYISKPTNRYQVWLRKPLEWKPLVDPIVLQKSTVSSCRCSKAHSSSVEQDPSHSIESCSGFNFRIRNWHVTPKFSSKVTERICNIPFKPNADHRSLPKPLSIKNAGRYAKFGDFDGNYGRLSYEGQFSTIITKMHPQNQRKCGTVLHPHQSRTLTLLEAQRAQGFPDRFKLEPMIRNGKVMNETISRQLFKMIGNSIPIPISMNLAKSLLKARETDFYAPPVARSGPHYSSSSSSSKRALSQSLPSSSQTNEKLANEFTFLKTCFDCLDLIDLYLDQ